MEQFLGLTELGFDLIIKNQEIVQLSADQLALELSVEQMVKEWNNFDFITDVCKYGGKGLTVDKDLLIEIFGYDIGNKLYNYNSFTIHLYNFVYDMINLEKPINTLDTLAFYDSVYRKLGKVIWYKYHLSIACQDTLNVIPLIEQEAKPGDLKDKINTTNLLPLNQKGCIIAAEYVNNIRIDERYSKSTLDLNLYLDWKSGSEMGSDEDPDTYRIDSHRPRPRYR